MEPAQAALLQDVLRRESRSLLQYVSESYPWAKAEGHAASAAVSAMAQAATALRDDGDFSVLAARVPLSEWFAR